MKLRLEYENSKHLTGGRNAWDYALFGVCLTVWLFMAALLVLSAVGAIR